MTRALPLLVAVLAAACASRRGGAPELPAPASPATVPPVAPSDKPAPVVPAAPRRSDAVRYGPSALRYVVHRQLHVQQGQAERPQATDLGARIYLAAAIAGPADSIGYPATFTVDSIVPDSGTPPPLADNLSRARKLVFSGRLLPRGEFVNGVASDSALAQSLVQFLANFRDFMPRLPRDGLTPGIAWTDTLEATQKGGGSEVSRRAILHSTAAAWEDHAGTRSLRLEATSTYQVAGAGQNLGQPFDLSGSGSATVVSFIAADGRYLGGESRDSTSLTVHLAVQGLAVPVTQLTHTTVAVLP
ncbi:MAG: hypothetical protein DMD51_03500 [Gemmatimonadetes bacterium]|nr:MAG: hypothetical protein AUI13_03825 [Gemmatimonadetes bacterium 13_2_20CM_2_69_23]PYO33166.1 MAG: hypothetical protein DMD32_01795 [Gemmatimonadota bacterium]PYP27029.1 MAG: hypothetical protein DMD51_03500 [Gemmatimonadota bacterium]